MCVCVLCVCQCLCGGPCGCSATGCRVRCHSYGEFYGALHIRIESGFGGLSCELRAFTWCSVMTWRLLRENTSCT